MLNHGRVRRERGQEERKTTRERGETVEGFLRPTIGDKEGKQKGEETFLELRGLEISQKRTSGFNFRLMEVLPSAPPPTEWGNWVKKVGLT